MEKWIAALPTSTEVQKTRQSQLQSELNRTRSELDDGKGLGDAGLVFSHCDLLSANCIIQPRAAPDAEPEIEDINFIDYEYATPCPAAFDIANHFAEWIGFDCDYSRTPTRNVRRGFLEEYVASFERHGSLGGDGKTREEVVEELVKDVDRYRGIPGFYWYILFSSISIHHPYIIFTDNTLNRGIWSLIQAQISQIDFDYAGYAELRLEEYYAWRAELDGSREKEGKEPCLREKRWAAEE